MSDGTQNNYVGCNLTDEELIRDTINFLLLQGRTALVDEFCRLRDATQSLEARAIAAERERDEAREKICAAVAQLQLMRGGVQQSSLKEIIQLLANPHRQRTRTC